MMRRKNWLAGAILVFTSIALAETANYTPPDLKTDIFGGELALTRQQKQGIAYQLSNLIRRDLKRDDPDYVLDSRRIMAICLRLFPDGHSPAATEAALEAGGPLPAAAKGPTLKRLAQLAANEAKSASDPDRKLGAYLYACVTMLDPADANAAQRLHELDQAGVKVSWDWLDGQHDSSPPAETGDQAGDEFPVGHVAHIARPQATIKILVVWENSGVALGGRATDFILTVTPANKPRPVTGHFVGHVGKEMSAVFGDVLRYIRLRHPSWYAANAEFSFAEREDYDGPSIGAAIGTLIGSVIDGFQIDPSAAITGDVSADGNVHAIGALAYKLHGAAAAHCDVVAVPMENYDNLVDAVIYSGPSIVTDVQVIGISTLDDAVGVMRSDRDPKLAQAISLFAGIQDQLKQSPGSLHRPEIQSQLQQILSLAPDHLSAKLLLLYGQNKLPRTLSATASLYYTRMAVYTMLPILSERAKFDPERRVPSSTVQEQLADLDKLRPIADPKIQPFIDAWTHFIRALVTLQNGYGSADGVRTAYQRLLDESAKIDADPDLSQKLLDEGM